MDGYPMPVADALVNAAIRNKVISFMDTIKYLWPQKILQKLSSGAQATSDYMSGSLSFGLKNVGATYQRAMNYIFHEHIEKIVEIYIDDVVVKSKSFEEHLADLWRMLECTRKHGLKMNPNKCAFGVLGGQFLGFLIHERGRSGPEINQRN
jgi:hypothetical protein